MEIRWYCICKFYVAHDSLIDLDDVTLYTIKEQCAYFCVILPCAVTGVDQSPRHEVVLFSKLNTLKFPNAFNVIAYIKRILEPARTLASLATHRLQMAVRRTQQRASYLQELAAARIEGTLEATLTLRRVQPHRRRRVQPHRRYFGLMSQLLRLWHRIAARRVMAYMQRMCIRETFLTLFRATHKLQMAARRTQHRARYLQKLDAARRVMACMQRMCVRETFLTIFRAAHKLQMAVRCTHR